MKSVCRKKRAQPIWPGETVSEMYFATVSCPGSTIIATTHEAEAAQHVALIARADGM